MLVLAMLARMIRHFFDMAGIGSARLGLSLSAVILGPEFTFFPVTGFRLVADVDWPSLFEYCGDGAAYWGVVDVTSLLHLTKVLLADSIGHFMNPDWIASFLLLLQDILLLAFRMPFAGLLRVACEAAELHCLCLLS
ncbi:hypothetical protein Nepgr_014826 [Nepenthes gracilis]|uniref:Uncharacterized protein n=1 Tax=Nepenthes gracilis TaxID=150966 RepID=A0AAD3SLM4_NEPGR|nr:hypothetical protein Nepgr_014826 [Nepenthes gracilis]